MDDQRFDALTKGLTTGLGQSVSRRAAWQLALAGVLGVLGVAAGTGEAEAQTGRLRSQHCLPSQQVCQPANPNTSTRRGTKHNHGCGRCCSGYSVRVGRGRKCSCRPDGMKSENRSQCCSGRRRNGRCFSPSPVSRLFEQGSGTMTSQSAATCGQLQGDICTDTVLGTLTGTPIDGTFDGFYSVTDFQPGPGNTFTAQVFDSQLILTESATGDTLTITIEGPMSGSGGLPPSGPFQINGTYLIISGTGRFTDAIGRGTAVITGTDNGPTGTIDSIVLDGNIVLATP